MNSRIFCAAIVQERQLFKNFAPAALIQERPVLARVRYTRKILSCIEQFITSVSREILSRPRAHR